MKGIFFFQKAKFILFWNLFEDSKFEKLLKTIKFLTSPFFVWNGA